MPRGLHARLCHAFLVLEYQYCIWNVVVPTGKSPSIFNLCSLLYGQDSRQATADRNDGFSECVEKHKRQPVQVFVAYIYGHR